MSIRFPLSSLPAPLPVQAVPKDPVAPPPLPFGGQGGNPPFPQPAPAPPGSGPGARPDLLPPEAWDTIVAVLSSPWFWLMLIAVLVLRAVIVVPRRLERMPRPASRAPVRLPMREPERPPPPTQQGAGPWNNGRSAGTASAAPRPAAGRRETPPPPPPAPLTRACRWRRDPAADWGRTTGTDVRRWRCSVCGQEGLGTERRGPQVCKRVVVPPRT